MFMEFDTYYKSLSKDERKAFAGRAKTSTEYLEIHLLPRRKTPRKEMMRSLALASGEACSYEKIVEYFYLADAA